MLEGSRLPTGRPTWAEINLDNLVHNLRLMKAAVGARVAVMAAVKADGYGHGSIECARALEREGVDWFGVALPEEGAKLRAAAVGRPILCLGGFWEGQEELLLAQRLTPAIFRLDLLERLDRAARDAGRRAEYHLKVDTGMGRLGVPHGNLAEFLDDSARFKHLRLDGVMTHMASADLPDKTDFTREQMKRFQSAVELVRSRGHQPMWIHQSNSAATHAYPEAHANLVRLGGVLYGLWRDVTNPGVPPLDWKPVLSLHTRIELVKTVPAGSAVGYGGTFVARGESRIATIPIGYEDGLPRALSSRGRVLVRGELVPIVGRVSMDLTLLDVTDLPGAEVGDEVVIIGTQGGQSITAEDLASDAGTLSYEVTCRISDRVARVYVKA